MYVCISIYLSRSLSLSIYIYTHYIYIYICIRIYNSLQPCFRVAGSPGAPRLPRHTVSFHNFKSHLNYTFLTVHLSLSLSIYIYIYCIP